jgi:AcrR family transcriptional regulator
VLTKPVYPTAIAYHVILVSQSAPPLMPRPTREESRALTRVKLREAALREFTQTGFAGASIDRIAEAAGLSRGAFYSNYTSKADLLLELLHEQTRLQAAAWHELLTQARSEQDVLTSLSEQFTHLVDHTPWTLFAVEAQLQAQRDPAFALSHRALRREVQELVRELLTSLFELAGKPLPADLDTLCATLYCWTLGLTLGLHRDDPVLDARAAGAMLARFTMSMVTCVSDGQPPRVRQQPTVQSQGKKPAHRNSFEVDRAPSAKVASAARDAAVKGRRGK